MTKTRKLSPEQRAYILARAVLEHRQKTLAAEMATLPTDTDAQFEAMLVIEQEARERIGMDAAETTERTARAALLTWGESQLARLPGYWRIANDVDALFVQAKTRVWAARRLAEILLNVQTD